MQMQLLSKFKDGKGGEETLLFDFSNMNVIKDLLENYLGMYFVGQNMDDELNEIEIKDGRIEVRTHQKNGWIRTNVYWDDGTSEELFDKED